MATPSIAVVGCGAIARSFHLPALARDRSIRQHLVLIDPNLKRARSLAHLFSIERTAADYREVLPDLDGAIVTTPHHLHYPIALDCLASGVHVLCEKPLATTAAEVRGLVKAADNSGVTLAVNNTMRLYPSLRRVHELIRSDELGAVRRIAIYWGERFEWPAESGFYFTGSGKGVLFDKGPHALDLVCWWLGGKPRITAYADDSLGGNEAVAKLSFKHGQCRGELELSWLSKYENVYRVEGEEAVVEGPIYEMSSLDLTTRDGRRRKVVPKSRYRTKADLATAMIENFIETATSGVRPLVAGVDVAPSIELIEECYERRSRFEMTWHEAYRRLCDVGP